MRAATSDTPQRAPAIIISVLCAVIYSEPLCGWLAACRFSAPPPLSLHASHCLPASLAGCLYMSVTSYVLWGCLWKINKQRRHNMVCATAGTCAVATTRARPKPRPANSEAAAAETAPAAEAEAENTGRQRCRDVARCGFLQHVRS